MNIRHYSPDYYMIETYTQNTEYITVSIPTLSTSISVNSDNIEQKYHNTHGHSSGKYAAN